MEEALLLAVEEEILKERRSWVLASKRNVTDEAYQRIYGTSQNELVELVSAEYPYAFSNTFTISARFRI